MKAHAVRSECVSVVRPPKAVRKTSKVVEYAPISIPTATTTPLYIQQANITSPINTNASTLNVPSRSSVWSNIQTRSDSVSSDGLFLDVESPFASTSSNASTTSPINQTNLNGQQKSSFIHEIVEVNTEEYFVDINSLPSTHPLLTRMLIAYEGIQRRRDSRFNRSQDCEGYKSRVYKERDLFDCHRFYEMTQVEIELIAGMLQSFQGYRELPHADKVEIFKNYWM
jgi:hypothetical protein